jgi:hypothetical protein
MKTRFASAINKYQCQCMQNGKERTWEICVLQGDSYYEVRLQSSWTHLISPSRNFVEVGWRSLFRSISPGKRCTSYNAPLTCRKRAADRWSLRNVLPRSSLFMVGKARNRMGRNLDCMADVIIGFHRCTFSKPSTEFNSDLAPCKSRDGSVGIVTRLRTGESGI